MIQVSYISASTTPMSNESLLKLLSQCRNYNAAHGITGMLLYANSTFVQVLEGEEAVVDELLERIHRDSRHSGVQMLERKTIQRREYSDWSMGFKRLSSEDLQDVEGLKGFLEQDFNTTYLGQHAGVVEALMNHFRKDRLRAIGQEELSLDEPDRLINRLNWLIRGAVRALAVLMVFTIFWGVIDVIYVLYNSVLMPTLEDFRARDIILTFGAFLTVLIAIEIFMNITLYLRDDVIHIRLVISTALMAIARKVIIIDFDKITPIYLFGTASIVLALGITYWLIGDRTLFGKTGRLQSVR